MQQLYIIIDPEWANPPSAARIWWVVKRNSYRQMIQVAATTSYESARAVLPNGLRVANRVPHLEFWEEPHSSSPISSACAPQP